MDGHYKTSFASDFFLLICNGNAHNPVVLQRERIIDGRLSEEGVVEVLRLSDKGGSDVYRDGFFIFGKVCQYFWLVKSRAVLSGRCKPGTWGPF